MILWVVVSSCLYLLQNEKNFVVVVPVTPLGTEDPRQALESVSEEGPHTFLEIVGNCVARQKNKKTEKA